MLHGFIKGLSLPIYLALKHLIEDEFSFSQVVDLSRATKRESIGTYDSGYKRPSN